MNIRPATRADLAAVHGLECAAFGEHGYPDFFCVRPGICGQARCWWPRARTNCWAMSWRAGEVANEGWILSLAVAPAARGRGLGRQLLQVAVTALESQGCKRIKLTVLPDNPALHLYQSLGFAEAGREEDYFGPGEPRLVMVMVRG
ncbi:GNAT family N-acetyltransferase [Oceanimonas sp. NS1]|nr:GNAT family N-acetyltransferase [Oceanimonas sp. NS1]